MTEPRQLRPFALRGGGHPYPVAAALDDQSDLEIPQAAAEADDDSAPAAQTGSSAPARGGAAAGATPPARPMPVQGSARGSNSDLEWLISPEESVEMIRASRSMAAPRPAAARASTAATASAPPAESVRAPAAAGWGSTAAPNGAAARPAAGAVAPQPLRAGLDDLWRGTDQIRRLAVGAGIAGVVLVAYLAGQLGGRGRASPTVQPTSASAPAPSTEAPVQPPSRDRAAERPVPSQTKPVQTAARITTPPSRGAVAPAPAVPAPRPAQPAAQPVQPAAQGAAPGPVVSAQPPAQVAPPSAQPAPAEPPPPAAPRAADVTSPRAVTATEPDRDLAAGGWAPVDRAAAIQALGGTFGAIEGLYIESITQSTAGARARVRVAQLTSSGERIVLTETRAGAAVRGAGPAVVTALRVMPASEAYPFSTGTVSLGNILITVKSTIQADTLRSLLAKLGDVTPGH